MFRLGGTHTAVVQVAVSNTAIWVSLRMTGGLALILKTWNSFVGGEGKTMNHDVRVRECLPSIGSYNTDTAGQIILLRISNKIYFSQEE